MNQEPFQYNKLRHACSSYSVFGVMAEEDLVVVNTTQSYARQTSNSPEAEGVKVKHFSWDTLEKMTNLTFNTLVIDCEGCLPHLIETYKHKFDQVKKIILENDEKEEKHVLDHIVDFEGCGEKCRQANEFFKSAGFKEKMVLTGGLHYHYVFTKD